VTAPHRSGDARPPLTAGRGRAVAIAAGVLLIILAAASLAFVLGGGLRETSRPTPSPVAAATDALPTDGTETPAAPDAGSPGATDDPGTATDDPGATSTDDPGTSASPPTPDEPKAETRANRIRIERLGIDQKIIEGDGIDAPIGKAAHFPSSGWPYGGTNIYIYGHARKGMFIDLWDARKGDEVVLDLVDGTSRTYVVTKVLPRVPWDAIHYLEPTPDEQLTIQTSTSYYATAPRFIVIAVPAP
jgi:LPXTG-site transpeptidase (sortase) family protein